MHLGFRKAVYILAIAVLLAMVASESPGQSTAPAAQQEHFQRTFSVTQGATVAVENYKGTIHVAGADGNRVVIDVHKRFEGSDPDRKWWMENVKVNFRNDPRRVEVKVEYPTRTCVFCNNDYTAGVELEIRVPRQTNLQIDGYKPDMKVSGIQGDLSIKSYKAPMLIESTSGPIHLDTYKGTVRLRDVAVRGALWVKSYKADTEISATSLGDSADLETYKGSIVVRVPASAGLKVDFEGGRRSSFSTDFALTSSTGFSGREVRGTVNQGGSNLRLRTEKGSVQLRKISGEL